MTLPFPPRDQRRRSLLLREPALRKHPLALVLLLGHIDALDTTDPLVIKVNASALYYRATRADVRKALRWLVASEWLVQHPRDCMGRLSYTLHHTKGIAGLPCLTLHGLGSKAA